MDRTDYGASGDGRVPASTLRDLLGVVFRQRRLVTLSFLGVFSGVALAAVLLPEQYEAHMKILVKQERVDPVVTAQANVMPQISNTEAVIEEDLNSEIALMTSRDLLEKVVQSCGLDAPGFWDFSGDNSTVGKGRRMARAVRKLDEDLHAEPAKKSSLIEVKYASANPELSARVLMVLANEYLVKHLTVQRPSGAFNFFQQQTEQYRRELAAAEAHMAAFSREEEGDNVSPQTQRDLKLQKASDFEASLQQAEASVAQTQGRIRALGAMAAATPSRLATTDRKSDNPLLLGQLKSSLLTLELQRTQLLDSFEPSYRPVQLVEAQIAEARAAIAREEKAPVHEETTDRNPTYQWLDGELAKARADLASFQGQAKATALIVRDYRSQALLLNQKDIEQQALLRSVKAGEANYLLYLNKREEARISDALDVQRITNVAIAEAPAVPALPVHSRWLYVLLGIPCALLVSVGSAFVADHFDASFRTPEEVAGFLNTAVLAAMPSSTV
jgi:uncharacterized protein involved in exopolysaccharide biosynthesis